MIHLQVAGNNMDYWSKLNSSLYAPSFLVQYSKGWSTSDHSDEECALHVPKQDPKLIGGQAS